MHNVATINFVLSHFDKLCLCWKSQSFMQQMSWGKSMNLKRAYFSSPLFDDKDQTSLLMNPPVNVVNDWQVVFLLNFRDVGL